MSVTIHIRKGEEYIWKVAKATAVVEKISLSRLVAKALLMYCTRDNRMQRD